jgi:heme-degrading monooxygenase HmoA
MLAVIFEVQPRRSQFDRYLEIAGSLRPELEKIDGFIEIERFASRQRRGRVLSLSIWRDETSVVRWRSFGMHRTAQQLGRSEIFEDYRLRVGEIVADSAAPGERDEATVAGTGIVSIDECAPTAGGAPLRDLRAAHDVATAVALGILEEEEFESIYQEGKRLLLASWRDGAAADRRHPNGGAGGGWHHRLVRTIRDYGMFDRGEAPQYYPPVRPITPS